MIACMRRWLLMVMVLLLPLRAWVGEAMAGQMQQQHGAIVSALADDPARTGIAPASGHDHDSARVHSGNHAHAHDCDHAQANAPAVDDGAPLGNGHTNGHADCPTCASCQVCSSVALATMDWPSGPIASSHPRPQAAPSSYASAESSLAYKPPRS